MPFRAGGWLTRITLAVATLSAIPARAADKTLYAFNPLPPPGTPATGAYPLGTLLRSPDGALYGSTWLDGPYGSGTIFKLSPPAAGQTDWNLSVVYAFTGGADGDTPNSSLVMDSSGAIYGTTQYGGASLQGGAFKLTPPGPDAPDGTPWQETVIHNFSYSLAFNLSDGAFPNAGLIMDNDGALYGTTDLGGSTADPYGKGFGAVFKLTSLDNAKTNWQETVLYRFTSVADGQNPMSTLTLDAAGALYGTTFYGGTGPCSDSFSNIMGCGTVFKLTPPASGQSVWVKATLHNFVAGADGAVPHGKLLLDAAGTVYGTTYQGGTGTCVDFVYSVIGCGIIYRLTPAAPGSSDWTESIIYTFTGPDGAFPQGGVIMDAAGTLFGTASGGGPMSYGLVGGYGLVFKLAPPTDAQTYWTETVLYNFDLDTSGKLPLGELVRDSAGCLFGVANSGGPNFGGTIFEVVQ
jgi:uncharacterized repeat protein (TIGR03803 family)